MEQSPGPHLYLFLFVFLPVTDRSVPVMWWENQKDKDKPRKRD